MIVHNPDCFATLIIIKYLAAPQPLMTSLAKVERLSGNKSISRFVLCPDL